jgi:hypothetical protein
MRTKLYKIAQAATLGFAITFTLSCSGGDDNNGGGGSNLSNLPKQAYFMVSSDEYYGVIKEKYDGDGYITLRIPYYYDYDKNGNGGYTCIDYSGVEHECEQDEYENRYEIKPAGIIKDGQVSLDLPDIESKYLRKEGFWTCDEGICNVSSPENLAIFSAGKRLYVTIPNPSRNCGLFPMLTDLSDKDETEVKPGFIYFSKSGEITGIRCRDYYSDYYIDLSKLLKTGSKFGWLIVCS